MTIGGDLYRNVHGKIFSRPTNFSWLMEEQLAGSGVPTSKAEFDWLKENGVRSILTVREDPLEPGFIRGFNYLHVETPDMSGSLVGQIAKDAGVNDVIVHNEIVWVFDVGKIHVCHPIDEHQKNAEGSADANHEAHKE